MSNEQVLNYEEDMTLDRHQLDFEWNRQPTLYLKYSVLYADLASYRDEAKEKLQRVDASIDLDIRSNWESFGFETKPTEAAIKSTIIQDATHIKASDEYIMAVREVNIAQGAKVALDHKKSALEKLSTLYLSGYWADPRIPEDAKNEHQKDIQLAHRSHLENNERIK